MLPVNIVTVILCLIIVLFMIRGLTRRFTPNGIFYSIVNTINNLLIFISLALSMYLTNRIFVDANRQGIFKWIYDIIPNSISDYLAQAGIMTFVIVTPFLALMFYFLLQFLRSLLDGFLKKLSGFICNMAEKGGRAVRMLMGVLFEVPKALGVIIIISLVISFMSIYYPGNPISKASEESSVYKAVYAYTVSPVMESSLGQKIPAFFWSSIEDTSTAVFDNNAVESSDKLQALGFLRFQYESVSNEEINSTAKEIVGNETDPRKKAYLLYRWVGYNIDYDWEKYNNVVSNLSFKDRFGAINTFQTRKGVCEDYSDLYAAMARTVGLKVRIVVGQGYTSGEWGGHAWNEVYIPDAKGWMPVDTTWAKAGNYFGNKDFYNDHKIEAVAAEW